MRFVALKDYKSAHEDDDIPVALISLESELQRRTALIERGVPESWVNSYWSASDYRGLHNDQVFPLVDCSSFYGLYGRAPLPGEVGCLTSHYSAIDWFYNKTNAEMLLVLEDDIAPNSPDSIAILSSVVDFFSGNDVVGGFVCHLGVNSLQAKLSYSRDVKCKQLSKNNTQLCLHVDGAQGLWLAHAYLISREAAGKYLFELSMPKLLCDDWLRLKKNCGFRLFYLHDSIFRQADSFISSIDRGNKLRSVNGFNSGSLNFSFGAFAKRVGLILKRLSVISFRKLKVDLERL